MGTVFCKDDPKGGHIYVIITPPSYPGVLIVNFTSNGPRKDQSCVLKADEHEVLTHESVVAFGYATVQSTLDVQKMFDDGVAVMKQKASDELMQKIWEGAYATNRMQIRCRELLEQTMPN